VALTNFFNITFDKAGAGVTLRSGNQSTDNVGDGAHIATFSKITAGIWDIFELNALNLKPLTGTSQPDNYYIEITGTAVLEGGNYDGSWAVVPVPAALPLLLTALGALGVIGRRKMKAAATGMERINARPRA
jgi:hypothetical protein